MSDVSEPVNQPGVGEVHRVNAAFGGESTLSATAAIGLPPRTWEQRWLELLARLQQIEEIYSSGRLHQTQQATIVNFFKECRELADWIQNSKAAAGAVRYAAGSAALKICDAIAQADKHYLRDRGSTDPMTAHVLAPEGALNAISATIAWSTRSGLRGTEDALDLARRCMVEWQYFCSSNGLKPPR